MFGGSGLLLGFDSLGLLWFAVVFVALSLNVTRGSVDVEATFQCRVI